MAVKAEVIFRKIIREKAEMEKRADTADISVLFFWAVLIFWLYMRKQTKTLCYYHCAKSNMLKLLCYYHCAIRIVLLALCL